MDRNAQDYMLYISKMKRKKRGALRPSPVAHVHPKQQRRTGFEAERGIVTHVELVVTIVAATAVSIGLGSSSTAGSAGSMLLRGGELVLGRLAVERVGELIGCDCPSGGVELEPVEWV
jgi:hypothetical protein